MDSHLNGSGDFGLFAGTSLTDLPKSWTFTSCLPADSLFPTPIDSHKTSREDIRPRLVKGALFTYIRPATATHPELLCVSPAALQDLGIKAEEANTEEFRQTVAGNRLLGWDEEKGGGGYPWAQCYGGWQFGSWEGQLGDGRAISLFETTNPSTKARYELQLKGAGTTPYSRFADGRAVLRSSIREFIVSEALSALRIPTTRALSLTLLPHCRVQRELMEPCAIISRFAESWLRIGTFDLFYKRGERDLIRKLSTYVAENVFDGWASLPARLSQSRDRAYLISPPRGIDSKTVEGPPGGEENRFTRLYREIVRRNAKTVAAWQAYAFVNGVLNSDNTSIFGLSLDFGPFAFLDDFDPNYTPNRDDRMGRYSYRNQPSIIWWNLIRLAESMGELIGQGAEVDDPKFVENGVRHEDADELVARAEGIVERASMEYTAVYLEEYNRLMNARLGLKTHKDEDCESLFNELLDIMEVVKLDFNQFFRKLSSLELVGLDTDGRRRAAAGVFFHQDGMSGRVTEKQARKRLGEWLKRWRVRIMEDWGSEFDQLRRKEMKKVNPNFIPKSWILDELVKRVDNGGEREILDRVLHMALHPFEESWGWDEEEEERFCGDVPREDRTMQCSCSS